MDKRASSQVMMPQILTRVGMRFLWRWLQPAGFLPAINQTPQAARRDSLGEKHALL
jgi:hypothetical protein